MTPTLTLTYRFSSTDDFGWLQLRVETSRFSGTSGNWVQWQDVAEWSGALLRHPITAEAPVEVDWGFSEADGSNAVTVLGVSISPANSTGDLAVLVKLADHYEPRNRCETTFRTNYPQLVDFARDVRLVMANEKDVAVLTGQVLAFTHD